MLNSNHSSILGTDFFQFISIHVLFPHFFLIIIHRQTRPRSGPWAAPAPKSSPRCPQRRVGGRWRRSAAGPWTPGSSTCGSGRYGLGHRGWRWQIGRRMEVLAEDGEGWWTRWTRYHDDESLKWVISLFTGISGMDPTSWSSRARMQDVLAEPAGSAGYWSEQILIISDKEPDAWCWFCWDHHWSSGRRGRVSTLIFLSCGKWFLSLQTNCFVTTTAFSELIWTPEAIGAELEFVHC